MKWWWLSVGVWAVVWQVSASMEEEEVVESKPSPQWLQHNIVMQCDEEWLSCLVSGVRAVWTVEHVKAAGKVKRAVRTVGRHARDLSALFSPFMPSTSLLTQILSWVPGAMSATIRAVSNMVYVAGSGVEAAGSSLGYGGNAVNAVGNGIKKASYQVPTFVTVIVLGGLALLVFFPGLQTTLLSTIASGGLALAGYVANNARTLVDDDSLWATAFDALQRFIARVSQDLSPTT